MIIVTGAAGFVGFHTSMALIRSGIPVVGADSLNQYYDPSLKLARIRELTKLSSDFEFVEIDLSNRYRAQEFFAGFSAEVVIHMAAQAGVQFSISHPYAYLDANLSGFVNVCEGCRNAGTRHLIYASSSSVYGDGNTIPFSEMQPVQTPVSLYAATKIFDEAAAHAYSHLYGFRSTGLRFFTVYGPWGRPDMSYWKFADAIYHDKPITLYFDGLARRDFTYIDDVVDAIVRIATDPRSKEDIKNEGRQPSTVYNIGNHTPVTLLEFVNLLERVLGKRAKIRLAAALPGDVFETFADVSALQRDYSFSPDTPLEVGLGKFADWYVNQWLGSPKADTISG